MKTLAAGLLFCAAVAAWAGEMQTPAAIDGLTTFLESVQGSEPRAPGRYSVQLPAISSRNGRRTVTPAFDVVAGRLDGESCLYQLRVDLRWSDARGDTDDAASGGRSLIQKAPCATLVQEVIAVAVYEISALERRLHDGGRFASNHERDQIIAATRRVPAPRESGQTLLTALTIDSRVHLRASPSLQAPVLSKLAPASLVQVVPTASEDWYQMQGRPGYLHASALQSLHPAEPLPAPAEPPEPEGLLLAEVGTAHVAVRDEPSLAGRVVGRLKPGLPLHLLPADASGWYVLEDGSGFVPAAGMQRVVPAERPTGGGAGIVN